MLQVRVDIRLYMNTAGKEPGTPVADVQSHASLRRGRHSLRIIYDTRPRGGIVVTVRGRHRHVVHATGHRITLWSRVGRAGGHWLDLRGFEIVYHAIDFLSNKIRAWL